MNAEPHIHEVKVQRWHTDPCSFTVTYGDQTGDYIHLFAPWFWVQWRVRAIIRRLINRHDRQSWLAGQGQLASDIESIKQEFNNLEEGRWGSDQL